MHSNAQDIADEFWVGTQRERKQRLVTVGQHQVLRDNMYDLETVSRRRILLPVMCFKAMTPATCRHPATLLCLSSHLQRHLP